MKEEIATLQGADATPVHVYRWHPDDGAGNGDAVQIIHGLGEHGARYRRLARHLTDAGFLVAAHDQRGHGRTSENGVPGHFADADGWQRILDDVAGVRAELRALSPQGRHILLGHSMGSYIAQSYLLRHPRDADALVLSGSTFASRGQLRVFRIVAAIERFRQGRRGRSPILEKLSFGAFNKEFRPNRTEFDWLSRDHDEVDRYIRDPLCGGRSTNQLWRDLTGGLLEISAVPALSRLPHDLPVLILGGDMDPVGGARGLGRLFEACREAGLARTTLKLYPDGRHEMFNETNRDEVTRDLVTWLQTIREAGQSTVSGG